MYNGASSIIKNNSTNHNKTFLCFKAWIWLLAIVLTESTLIIGWLLREYHYFDYKCVFYRQFNTSGGLIGPRTLYAATDKQNLKKRNLRIIDVNSPSGAFPDIIQDGPNLDFPMLIDSNNDRNQFMIFDKAFSMENDFKRFKRHIEHESIPPQAKLRRRKIKKKRRKKINSQEIHDYPSSHESVIENITESEELQPIKLSHQNEIHDDSNELLTTVESYVMIEQLPLTENRDSNKVIDGRIKTIRAKTTKIKHLSQNPSNSTTLRKRLKKRKKIKTKITSTEEMDNNSGEKLNNQLNQEKRYYNLDNDKETISKLKINYNENDSNIYSSGDIPRRRTKTRRYKTRKKPATGRRLKQQKPTENNEKDVDSDEKSELKIQSEQNLNKINVTTTTTVPPLVNTTNNSLIVEALSKSIGVALNKDEKSDEKKDDEITTTTETIPDESNPASSRETKAIPVRSIDDANILPNRPPGYDSRSTTQVNSTEMVEKFSSLVLCVSRFLFNIWCVLQLFASIPFLIGICVKLRCFFFLKLLLDSVFLFVLFIYTMTVLVYPCFLYAIIDGMTTELVIEWLIFGVLLFIILTVYVLLFITILRCCDILLNNQQKPKKDKRSKSLLYTEIGSEQLLETADEV